jgi:naphthoate synthase
VETNGPVDAAATSNAHGETSETVDTTRVQAQGVRLHILGRTYSAEDMQRMGAVNIVADHADLETEALQMAREINAKSPTAQRMLKFAFNLTDDGLMGQQVFAGEATRLAYMTDEAVEGRDSFLEKRAPDWSPCPYYY